jgi:putative ABC transport system permease protein
VQTVSEYIAEISSQIQTSLNIIYVLLGLAVIEALIGISNTIALSVFERTRELGLLRAVGMGRRQLRRAIRWEAAIIASFGSILGLVMGTVFGGLLVSAFATGDVALSLHIPWVELAVIVVAGGMLGVIAAMRSARRAGKLDILAAIASP